MFHVCRARAARGCPPAFVVLLAASTAAAQPAAAPPGETAGQKYKNVQVLKHLTVGQFEDAMVLMGAATGQTCLGCHVRTPEGVWQWEKDDKDHKTIARTMISMTETINRQHFKGAPEVTCATCHQGRTAPAAVSPLAQPLTSDQIAMAAARVPGQRPQPPAETVDQIFEKYLTAAGGRDALTAAKTRVMKGQVATRAGQTVPFAVEERAAGQYRATTSLSATQTIREVFDGTGGWVASGAEPRSYHGVEVAAVSRFHELGLALRLRNTLRKAAVGRYEKIDGRDVVSINAESAPDVMETLYFDRSSGLLVRRVARIGTVLGRVAVQMTYGDYRSVSGIQVPHRVTRVTWDNVMDATFSSVTVNAPLDEADFKR